MARAEIGYIITKDNGDAATAASVQVNVRSTGNPATVYSAETGGSTTANPIAVTNGRIEGWLDEGSYNFIITGTGITSYTQPVEIVRGDGVGNIANNAVTNAKIADGTINLGTKGLPSSLTLEELGPDILRQLLPIGAVISWFRPNNTVAVPSGFVICDGGTSLNDTQHDFGAGITFTVPDLRNKFILGASTAIADGNAGANADGAANAPGIRGSGGSNASWGHTHTVDAHTHSMQGHTHSMQNHTHTLGAHYHSMQGHTHGSTSDSSGTDSYINNFAVGGSGAGWVQLRFPTVNHYHATGATTTTNTGGPVGASDGPSAGDTSGPSVASTGTASVNTASTVTKDLRPAYYGLLQIMKVKRS